MGTAEWDQAVTAFYEERFDENDPEGAIAAMRELVALLPRGHAWGLFELGGVHDSLGRDEEAIRLYQQAMAAGLTGERAERVIIQLASTLRTQGRAKEAIELLGTFPAHAEDADAAQAFLALALFDDGRHEQALATALRAFIPTLGGYRRALTEYVDALEPDALTRMFAGFLPEVITSITAGLEALHSTPAWFSARSRSVMLHRVAQQHGCERLAAQYVPTGGADVSREALAYLDAVSLRPAEVVRSDVDALLEAGYSPVDVILLNQIAAIGAVASRLIEGMRCIRGEVINKPALAEAAAVTVTDTAWEPWLAPLVDEEIPEDLRKTYGSRLNLPFLRVLARTPDLLAARVKLDQIALLSREGVDRADREIAATVISRMSGCDTCAKVHAGKAAQFLKDESLEEALLLSPSFGEHEDRRAALIRFCAGLAATPAVPSAEAAERLRELGFSDEDLAQIVAAVAYMAWPNRVTLGLGQARVR